MGKHMIPHLKKTKCGIGAEVGVKTTPAPHLLGGVGVVREIIQWWWRSGAGRLGGPGGGLQTLQLSNFWTGAQPKFTQSQIDLLSWSIWLLHIDQLRTLICKNVFFSWAPVQRSEGSRLSYAPPGGAFISVCPGKMDRRPTDKTINAPKKVLRTQNLKSYDLWFYRLGAGVRFNASQTLECPPSYGVHGPGWAG